jgi:hypothetical protein
LVLTATIDELDKPLVEALVAHLRKVSGDTSLTLQKIKAGSVKLILDSSFDGFNQIKSLFENGQLKDLLGIPIQEVSQEIPDINNQQEKGFDQLPVQLSLDNQLEQLAVLAQSYPSKSRDRQRALTRLISSIQKSGELIRPRQELFQGLYEEVYAESVQRLFAYICERIDTYNPERGKVLQWANFLLGRQFFIEASREILSTAYKVLETHRVATMSLEDLDRIDPVELSPQIVPSLSEQVLQYLEEDPEDQFQQTHLTQYPEVNFQYVAIQRLSGHSWQELSTELGVPALTLIRFYSRCLVDLSGNKRK